MAEILRFLWAIEHKKFTPTPIFLESPHDHKQAVDCLHNALRNIFPDTLPDALQSRGQQPSSGKVALPIATNTPHPTPRHPNPFTGLQSANTATMTPKHGQGASGVSPDMIFLTQKVSEAITHQSTMLKAHEDWKDHFKSLLIHTRNSLIFGQVGPKTTTLPLAPSAMAVEIFKQKNTYVFYQTVHAQIFRRTDNNCYILFGQCGILQKFGPRLKAEEQPSGFSPLSLDPYYSAGASNPQAIDHDIYNDLFEYKMRQANGISMKEMKEIFCNHRLFYPVTGEEFHLQLRSYYLFAAAIWGRELHIPDLQDSRSLPEEPQNIYQQPDGRFHLPQQGTVLRGPRRPAIHRIPTRSGGMPRGYPGNLTGLPNDQAY